MKKIYIVPNLVTTANMACGFYSVVASFHGDYQGAAWAILAAAVFDMLDGRIARLAKATSQFGVEYDSLSDLMSFGMAPAILIYLWQLEPLGRLGWLAAFLFVACGALRLARFNVTTSKLPKAYFQGLPIPGGAATIATGVIFHQTTDWPSDGVLRLWALILALGLSTLMVSTLKFPSFKDFHWRSRASSGYLLVGVALMVLVATKPEITLFLVMIAFILFALGLNIVHAVAGEPRPAEAPHPAEKN